jgi:hypothetical protein
VLVVPRDTVVAKNQEAILPPLTVSDEAEDAGAS